MKRVASEELNSNEMLDHFSSLFPPPFLGEWYTREEVTGKSSYLFVTQLMNSAMKESSLANCCGHISWNVHFERWSVGEIVIAKHISSRQLLISSESAWKKRESGKLNLSSFFLSKVFKIKLSFTQLNFNI